MEPQQTLAAINSVLVTTSGLFILRGILSVYRGRKERHIQSMAIATVLLSIFLVIYVYRFSQYGITQFPGPDWAKVIYYTVMISHVTIATLSTPMVLMTLLAARRKDFQRHRRLGRITYPLWLYVAATGPLVYLMLYHWF